MIVLDHVSKAYGKRRVVRDLSLQIPAGTAFGFLGQNGAGKTTTMKMIVGLAEPDAGRVTIAGRPASDPRARNSMGYMPEAPYFYERLTGAEFMRLCAALRGLRGQDVPREVSQRLGEVGLDSAAERRIAGYSKGMKQRLGFAQALLGDPEYLLLDEPLDGLDPIGRKEIKAVIRSFRERGKTVFFNSHILYDTEELCDQIGILHEGALVYAGALKEFCAGMPLEQRFVQTIESL